MKIEKATVLLTWGPDEVILATSLPCTYSRDFMPSQQSLELTFKASYGTGADYVKDFFAIEPKVLDTRFKGGR